ncbi:PorT family protein [Bizionia argentinensis JUB59]|uniref:PorT family protein n=1 Tax=Bizionia argentinensis JUB59 TaxID=1046627 RepID=G2EF94_9FLAO|nr:outer membrane beta-barrel protein [Bizionia argentinensis]EGV42881.1 PorT family protein [Bizionia argentinensis JUB59]
MKNLLVTLLFLLVMNLTFSQNKKGIGLRAGANISNLTNADMDVKTNLYLGLIYQVRFSELYALQPELGYSNQGGKTRGNNTIYIEYITLAVSNKFFVAPDLGFYLSVTPGIDFDIDDTLIGFANRGDNHGNDATFVDLNFSFGFGLELKNGLSFEARYKRGFIDVYSGTFNSFESELYETQNQFNTVFQLGINYQFNLTKK